MASFFVSLSDDHLTHAAAEVDLPFGATRIGIHILNALGIEKRKHAVAPDRKIIAEKAAELAAALADQEIATAEAEVARIKTLTIARTLGYTISKNEDGVEYIDFENSNGLTQKDLYDYMNYIKYLEAWDGELPEVVGNGGEYIIPPDIFDTETP